MKDCFLILFCVFSVCFYSCNKDKTSKENCKSLINDPDTFSADSGNVWVANAFTPNGDGLNDVFIPIYVNVESTDFKVFDGDGKIIFQTQDKLVGFIPEELPKKSDEYFFRVQSTLANGRRLGMCGNFHAIKCLPKDMKVNTLHFPDQIDPTHGFVLPTSELLETCPSWFK